MTCFFTMHTVIFLLRHTTSVHDMRKEPLKTNQKPTRHSEISAGDWCDTVNKESGT